MIWHDAICATTTTISIIRIGDHYRIVGCFERKLQRKIDPFMCEVSVTKMMYRMRVRG
jgi:hypothetical protein